MAPRSFSEVKLAVLLKLYFAEIRNIAGGHLTSRQITSLNFGGTSRSLVKKALSGLNKDGLVHEDQDFSTGDFDFIYDISAEGLSYVEAEVNKGQGYLAENFERELEWADTFVLPTWSPLDESVPQATGLHLSGDATVEQPKLTEVAGGAPNGALPGTAIGFPNDAAPKSASTAPEFGMASIGELAIGEVGGAPLNTTTFNGPDPVPASNRYVSVRDNQSPFDEILRSLTIIKNEFAGDHFKHTNFINAPAITAEIEGFEHQIHSGWVSRPAAQNFLDTLRYIKDVCVEFKEICVATAIAIAALSTILGMLL